MAESLRTIVRRRSGGFCEYCRVPEQYDRLPFQLDHIIAEKHGGTTTADNLAWSCFDCNSYKGPNIAGLDPSTNDLQPLFHPRQQSWEEHFRSEQGKLIGLTPEGRVTIEVLRIDLQRRVAFRKALLDEGVYPLA